MGLSVLLVDDEKVFRNFIGSMQLWGDGRFTLGGEAKNTKEAMAFLGKRNVDVVILDVSMPGKNGVVLSEMIAGKYPAVSMVAVSSHDDYDYVRQILKNGAHDYILKSRLSEALLERTLENIALRLAQVSPWELKKKLRLQAGGWLLGDEENPFTSDNARKVAALVELSGLDGYPEEEKKTMLDGIARLLEGTEGEKMDVLAVYAKKGRYVLIYRFFEETSEARIRERVENSRIACCDSIRRMYGISASVQTCPFFFGDHALRSFVRHKLEEGQETKSNQTMRLAMTIGQQNRLLSAIDRGNVDMAEKLVQEIYQGIGPKDQALYLMVTKELLDLLERLALEYEINLDFVPKNVQLFTYTKGKSKDMLAASIAWLYRNVLREMAQHQKGGKKNYSGLVAGTVRFMEEHCHEAIGLSDVAAGVGVNPSYLSRVFHEETGKTFTDYFNGIRMGRAEALLRQGLPVKEVAAKCGIKNYGYFLKIFKDYTGKTPKEYVAHNGKE